jgi:hypothetical protein
MKYLITESQLDNVIFKYLNMKRFIQIDNGYTIYFVNSEDDGYAQIRYDKSGWCLVYKKIVKEISRFFSLEEYNAKQVIGRWVENTLQMEVFHIYPANSNSLSLIENA